MQTLWPQGNFWLTPFSQFPPDLFLRLKKAMLIYLYQLRIAGYSATPILGGLAEPKCLDLSAAYIVQFTV